MKVYISGPVTGTDDYVERFQKAEDKAISIPACRGEDLRD